MWCIVVASWLFFTASEAQDFCRQATGMEPWAPGLVGSRASLWRQNDRADQEGLLRIKDDIQLAQLQQSGYLVPIRETSYLKLHEAFWKKDRRRFQWARPNAVTFADDTAAVFYQTFGVPLRITSAVRTLAYQQGLSRNNANAAPTVGARASVHPTGATIDFAKRFLSDEQQAFLRAYLEDLERRGLVEVTEEHHQPCFHVMVFSTYPARTFVPDTQVVTAPQ